MSRLVDDTSCVSEDLLSFSRSALTVGVYEETAKAEIQDPGDGSSF